MKGEKVFTLANFNCVFEEEGGESYPMLDFFELNNDDLSDFFDMADNFKKEIGSKEMKHEYKNPTNKDMVAEMIQKTEGKAEITLVANKQGEKSIPYKNEYFKEKKVIYLPEHEEIEANILKVVTEIITDVRMKKVSQENEESYKRALKKFDFLKFLL